MLVESKVRQLVGLLEVRIIFLFSGYEGLILLVIFVRHFLHAIFH